MFKLLTLSCLVFTACATNAAPSGITTSDVTCPPDSTLTYANFGEVFIADNCLSCHPTKARPDLSQLTVIQNNPQSLMKVAVTGTSMPKGSSMAIEDRQLLGEWLACGAP